MRRLLLSPSVVLAEQAAHALCLLAQLLGAAQPHASCRALLVADGAAASTSSCGVVAAAAPGDASSRDVVACGRTNGRAAEAEGEAPSERPPAPPTRRTKYSVR